MVAMIPRETARALILAERAACAAICDAVATMPDDRGPKDFLRRELTKIVKGVAREIGMKIRMRP